MKEKTRLQINYAVKLFKWGLRDRISLSQKLGISTRTLFRWSRTDLWKRLMGDYKPNTFRIPCQRKNIAAYIEMKKRYEELTVNERHKVGILVRHPECKVSEKTLRTWRKHWQQEIIRGVPSL